MVVAVVVEMNDVDESGRVDVGADVVLDVRQRSSCA